MRGQSINSFNKGLTTDLNILSTPKEIYIDSLNATVITHSGGEFAIQTERGNKKVAMLPEGYLPLGAKDYNGIAYIISYNPTTNKGQIGSYPSPDPNSNNLIDSYLPFQNYLNEALPINDTTINDLSNYGDFDTSLFNLSLCKPLDVEIQQSYDNTVNVIFTDNNNKIRIINSRFSQLPNKQYEIINRLGTNDGNLYNKLSFDSRINLIQTTVKIPVLEFNGVLSGGKLQAGGYYYYFFYETQDGNRTDVIEQSRLVSVFEGSTLQNIKGGAAETNKLVQFTLSNLDISYPYLRVYYSYAIGETDLDSVQQLYLIENLYEINADTLTFIHTGYENVTLVDNANLNLNYSSIAKARTLAQVQGRLFIGNVSERTYDYVPLQELAKGFFADYAEEQLPSYNTITDIDNNVSIDQTNNTGGYANPINIYNKVGYWGGETYQFGVVFILNDGTTSNVFPCTAVDRVANISGSVSNPNYSINGWDSYQNINGALRFPNRTQLGQLFTTNSVTILGVKFTIPTIPQEVKDIAKGLFFVRANRIQDCYIQGLVTPTLKVNSITTTSGIDHDDVIFNNSWAESVMNSRAVLPIPTGYIESSGFYRDDVDQFPGDVNLTGLSVPRNVVSDIDNSGRNNIVGLNRMSLFSPDYYSRRAYYSSLFNNTQAKVVHVGEVAGLREVAFEDNDNSEVRYFNTVLSPKELNIYPQIYEESEWSFLGVGSAQLSSFPTLPTFVGYNNSADINNITVTTSASGNLSTNGRFTIPLTGIFPGTVFFEGSILFNSSGTAYDLLFVLQKNGVTISSDNVTGGAFNVGDSDSFFLSLSNFSVNVTDILSIGVYYSTNIYANALIDFSFSSILDFTTEPSSKQSNIDFVPGYSNNVTVNRFKSQSINFALKRNSGASKVFWLINSNFNDYIGIRTQSNYTIPQIQALMEDYTTTGSDLYAVFREYTLPELSAPSNDLTGLLGYLVNIYPLQGQRSLLALQSLYASTNNTVYKAMSRRYTFEELELLSDITEYSGDCYIGFSLRKVQSALPSLPPNASYQATIPNSINIGYAIGVIAESSVNPYLRDEQELSTQETADYGAFRTFLPYGVNNTIPIYTTSPSKLANLRLFPYKLPESYAYNMGHYDPTENKLFVPISQNVPFIGNRFPTRIQYSAIDVNNQFANGYRNLTGLNFEDYAKHYGEIVKLVSLKDNLVCVFEHGIALIPINKDTVALTTTGTLQLASAGVLYNPPQIVSFDYGSRYQWSIVQTKNTVYGVDVEKSKIWRLEGDRINLLSDFKVQSLLRSIIDVYRNNTSCINTLDVRGHYNQYKGDVSWTFYAPNTVTEECCNNSVKSNSFTITFNEDLNQWSTLHSWMSPMSFSVYDKFYTFKDNGIWEHDTPNYCNYYDEQFTFEVEFVVTDNTSAQKIFDTLKIISNNSIPIKVKYINDNDNVTQITTERKSGNILNSDVQYKENHVYLIVNKNNRKRIRDKYSRIRLIYKGTDYTFISAVITQFTYSYS